MHKLDNKETCKLVKLVILSSTKLLLIKVKNYVFGDLYRLS